MSARWPRLALLLASALATLLIVPGCDGCGGASDSGGGSTVVELELPPLPEDVPMPGALYQQAYDRALGEVTPENARDRLRQIERTIARERRELP